MSKTVRVAVTLIVGALFTISMAAAFAQQQQIDQGMPPPTGQNQQYILITTVAGFLSLLATNLFSLYRDSKRRQWDMEDRHAARLEMKKEALIQRAEIVQTAVELSKVTERNRDKLLGAIQDNTHLTAQVGSKAEAAYAAANDFNAKLEALHAALRELASGDEQKKKAV